MALKFVTSLTKDLIGFPNAEAWDEVHAEAHKVRAKLHADGRASDAALLENYGRPLSRSDAGKPLWIIEGLRTDDGDLPELMVTGRQVDESLFDLPPLYTFSLALEVEGSLRALCESLPFSSLSHARDFFNACLDQQLVTLIADSLGGSAAAKAFALCVLPASSEKLVTIPNPTHAEVQELTDELAIALKTLAQVVGRWEGKDAFQYLVGQRGVIRSRWLFQPRGIAEISQISDDLAKFRQGMGEPIKRPGRRPQGGKNHMVAQLVRALWLRCGMTGKVSFSASSRFMKACNLALPMHGIPKADYSQFMKSELAKRRVKGVVIGK